LLASGNVISLSAIRLGEWKVEVVVLDLRVQWEDSAAAEYVDDDVL
jgi:hypothetical protein